MSSMISNLDWAVYVQSLINPNRLVAPTDLTMAIIHKWTDKLRSLVLDDLWEGHLGHRSHLWKEMNCMVLYTLEAHSRPTSPKLGCLDLIDAYVKEATWVYCPRVGGACMKMIPSSYLRIPTKWSKRKPHMKLPAEWLPSAQLGPSPYLPLPAWDYRKPHDLKIDLNRVLPQLPQQKSGPCVQFYPMVATPIPTIWTLRKPAHLTLMNLFDGSSYADSAVTNFPPPPPPPSPSSRAVYSSSPAPSLSPTSSTFSSISSFSTPHTPALTSFILSPSSSKSPGKHTSLYPSRWLPTVFFNRHSIRPDPHRKNPSSSPCEVPEYLISSEVGRSVYNLSTPSTWELCLEEEARAVKRHSGEAHSFWRHDYEQMTRAFLDAEAVQAAETEILKVAVVVRKFIGGLTSQLGFKA